MATKKFFVIASTEYEANMPDLFVMDADGNYYGVTDYSYALWDNFPKDVAHWQGREGSDAGRYFNIDEVELNIEDVSKFDQLTNEHKEVSKAIENVRFQEVPPCRTDYKSKNAYIAACRDWEAKYFAWSEAHGIKTLMQTRREKWEARTRTFLTFSKKVTEALSDNHEIRRVL